MGAIKECFTETQDSHKISSMRVSVLVTVLIIMGTFVAHNIAAMMVGEGFVSLETNEAFILATALGLKAFQRKSEASPPPLTISTSVGEGAVSDRNNNINLTKPD